MPRLFEITADIRRIAQDGFDDLLDQLGKECQLIYPPVGGDCPNCIKDTINNTSTNRYNGSGSEPFDDGEICPVCNGTGHIESQSTESITLLMNWEPKNFVILGGNVQKPYSVLETKGYMIDAPKVMRAQTLIAELPITPYIKATFALDSEPVDRNNIIQGRYFVCIWKRI